MADRGLSKEVLDRVKVPAGLDLGKVSHREIAVGILAELVKLRAAGELAAGEAGEVPEIEEGIDPVCGMTVEVAAARHTFDHEGTTYYFCCPGCRKAFEKDPAGFVGSATQS
ncbi:MAG: YHS domain-containing protein [Actinobacteria bacterium]|nr:YHS domain-containing protein [Actinomycetota bacterium]